MRNKVSTSQSRVKVSIDFTSLPVVELYRVCCCHWHLNDHGRYATITKWLVKEKHTIESKDIIDDIVFNVVKASSRGSVISISQPTSPKWRLKIDIRTNYLRTQPRKFLFFGITLRNTVLSRINDSILILQSSCEAIVEVAILQFVSILYYSSYCVPCFGRLYFLSICAVQIPC